MKIYLRLLMVFTIIALLFMAGCSSGPAGESVLKDALETPSAKTINLEIADTVGNHTYIPINIDGSPADNEHLILKIIEAFEKSHPELKVTFWSPQGRENSYLRSSYTFGLWVNHEPR
jgi:hypothetical protein